MSKGNWDKFKEAFIARDEQLGFINVKNTAEPFVRSEEVENRVTLRSYGVPASVVRELRKVCHNGQRIYYSKGKHAYHIYWPKALLTQEVLSALKEGRGQPE